MEKQAERALTSVARKLDKTLSVSHDVNELITQATDVNNLARIYHGTSEMMLVVKDALTYSLRLATMALIIDSERASKRNVSSTSMDLLYCDSRSIRCFSFSCFVFSLELSHSCEAHGFEFNISSYWDHHCHEGRPIHLV